MRLHRFRLLFVFVAIAATCSPLRAAEPELAFAVVGDWGKGNTRQKAVAEALGKAAESIGARFIVSAGDNFYPRGVASVSDPNWQTLFENVYTAPSLMVPWHAVLGNHDHRGSTAAQIEYSKTSTRWRLPAPFYKHSERITDAVDADFFFLDTTPLYQASRWPWRLWPFENEQYAWLKRELAASTADWKIVVGHHPVYSGGSHGNTPILIEKLQPLFEQFGVDAYFNGHDHALEHVVKDNVNYFTVGAGAGGSLTGTIEGSHFLGGGAGFMTARLHASDLQVEFFNENGASVYRAEILKSRKPDRSFRGPDRRTASRIHRSKCVDYKTTSTTRSVSSRPDGTSSTDRHSSIIS